MELITKTAHSLIGNIIEADMLGSRNYRAVENAGLSAKRPSTTKTRPSHRGVSIFSCRRESINHLVRSLFPTRIYDLIERVPQICRLGWNLLDDYVGGVR
jgi:hypothetical protein